MSERIWTAARVWAEGQPIRYVFYDSTETETIRDGLKIPIVAGVNLTPENALDLAWSLFEDVAHVAPDLVGAPRVERRHYDCLERTLKDVKAEVERAMRAFPDALKQMDTEWQSINRARGDRPKQEPVP